MILPHKTLCQNDVSQNNDSDSNDSDDSDLIPNVFSEITTGSMARRHRA